MGIRRVLRQRSATVSLADCDVREEAGGKVIVLT